MRDAGNCFWLNRATIIACDKGAAFAQASAISEAVV
jgi:hypothetical protein